MEMLVIHKENFSEINGNLYTKIEESLSDLNNEYPFFKSWLHKVFLELQTTDRRYIIACVDGEQKIIKGVAIIKKTPSENKICTLRVVYPFKRKGIGTALLEKSLELLDDGKPLITVSSNHIEEFKPFLLKHGFVIKDRVKSIYQKGIYEYFFNVHYLHKNVLLSIHPEFVKQIMDGRKRIEFRKKKFDKSVERVYVYSTSPVRRVCGYFKVTDIIEDTPEKIWSQFGDVGCISKERFEDYYKTQRVGFGIIINEFKSFISPVNPKLIDINFKAPQSYCYIDNIETLKWLSSQKIQNKS